MNTIFKSIDEKCKGFINILPFNRFSKEDYPVTTDEDLVFIDQEPSNEFNINEAGWIRNDISAFEYAENEQIAAQILSRFEEVKTDDIYKDMSDQEMFEACLPRRATTDPVIYSRYLAKLAEIQYKKLKEQVEEEDKRKQEEEWSKSQINEAENEKSAIADTSSSAMASQES